MIKIGICGGLLNDVIPDTPKESWMKDIPKKYYKKNRNGYLYEPALVAALNHKYKDVEVSYIHKELKESELEKNDVNFLVGLNLLYAWEQGKKEYNRVLQLMKHPKTHIYPSVKEQFFLFDKGDYLQYFEKKGIPIAPTFVIRDKRNPDEILKAVKSKGWASFVLKPHYAYANIAIKRIDPTDKNAKSQLSTYLKENKKFPAFVCQETMEGFAKFWEVKSFWLNGKFKYYIAMKACEEVFDESKIYDSCPTKFGDISPTLLKKVKKMGQQVMNAFPKTKLHGKNTNPLYVRIDFGCCLGNTLDGTSYFLNEIEYAGCGVFTEGNNVFHHWPTAYYKKSKEIFDSVNRQKKTSKRTKKTKRKRGRRR